MRSHISICLITSLALGATGIAACADNTGTEPARSPATTSAPYTSPAGSSNNDTEGKCPPGAVTGTGTGIGGSRMADGGC
jgi:hypothetical protein